MSAADEIVWEHRHAADDHFFVDCPNTCGRFYLTYVEADTCVCVTGDATTCDICARLERAE